MDIHFEIPGKFVAWQRTGVSSGRFFTKKETRDWQKVVAYHAKKAMAGSHLMYGPITMQCIFRHQIPESWPKKKKAEAAEFRIYPTGKPDASNLVKSIEDACNGIVYRDDAQIVELVVIKAYASDWSTTVHISQIV